MKTNCEDKLSYKDYNEAIAAKILAEQRGEKNLRPYKCREPRCGGCYHLAHYYED